MSGQQRTHKGHEARRQELLEAGLALFGTRSYEEVSIDDIAGALGVSKGLMYHYFGSKRGLYVEVIRLAAARLARTIEPAPERSPEENLVGGLNAYFDFVEERAEAYAALMQSGLGVDRAVGEILDETRYEIGAMLLRAVGIDEATPATRMAVRAWLGSVEAAGQDWIRHRDVAREDMINALSASLIVMLVRSFGQLDGQIVSELLGSELGRRMVEFFWNGFIRRGA